MRNPSLDASDAFRFARAVIADSESADTLSVPGQRLLNMAKVLVSFEEQQTRLAEDTCGS